MIALQGGRVVCPLSGLDALADVLLDGDRIAAVGRIPDGVCAEVVDCSGCIIAPGFVDLASDLGDPGATWREGLAHGSEVAAAGGFTDVLISPATDPVIDSPSIVGELRARAAQVPGARVLIAGSLTLRLEGQGLAELGLMAEAGCVALSDGGRVIPDARILRRVMEYAAPIGLPVLLRPGELSLEERGLMHEGRISTRIGLHGLPAAAEELGVARAVALVRLTGARVHLTHLTTARALGMLAQAQGEGLPITAAVPARSLLLTDRAVEESGYDTATRLLPPLRPEADRLAMIAGTSERLCVGADHIPWTRVEKELEFGYAQPGAVGFLTAAAAAWTALNGDALALVQAMSTRPAAVLGHQRTVTEGAAADLVVFDPEIAWRVSPPWQLPAQWRTRGCNEPLRGKSLRGRVRLTLVSGRVIYCAEA